MPKPTHPSDDGHRASLQQGVEASLWNEKSLAPLNTRLLARQGDQGAEDALFRKITWRLMPLLFTSYLFAFLDRINVGYAQLQMKTMLGISNSVYGFGAGLFFISYMLFQIPSNIWLKRLGARLTLGRIMILWGLTSAGTMFVRTPHGFYIARFLLGMFEAGLFPGIILYLVYWFPPKRRATVTSWFMLAIPVAGLLGGPFSGWVMSFCDMKAHLAGWQWMLLLEGLPASMLGFIFFFCCADDPGKAKWLTAPERVLLENALISRDDVKSGSEKDLNRLMVNRFRLICDLRLWGLAFVYFAAACGNYTYAFWLPMILRLAGARSISEVGWLSAVPYSFGIAGAIMIARSSDRLEERRWHVAVSLCLAAVALGATTFAPASLANTILLLSVGAFFLFGAGILFWTIPPTYFRKEDAATGIAMVSSIGSIGGFISPSVLGWIESQTGRLDVGIVLICLVLAGAALAVAWVVPGKRDRAITVIA